ncbi:hypothetical protein TARUN_4671 [Trichoderma arundinaceum]|uniref:FHA domain-containing protein n=1 Tax=Trichoderma arundinaceum TaxID=490622 RepID=A0A395NNL9_TRIAR|nr:hypothetical protein TARUN_4671 [Trichoderma arundinaceum]
MAPTVCRDEGELHFPKMHCNARGSRMLIPAAALVTLAVMNPPPEFAFPTRHIILRRSNSTALLGRMSKRNGTFTAAENNGWIDSAVISRDHAKLIFDPRAQRVFIKDVGSLHGTFYNNNRLKKHQAQALKDGDHIQLGIPIDRGSETCPACIMRVAIQFGNLSSPQGPTVFRVPDDSDEEVSAEEDNAIRSSSQILRDNNIRPAQNCISPHDPVITIEISDHEMDSPEPEDHQTVSTKSIQDHMTDRANSEKSHSRIPTPPGTVDISDEDALFYGDDYDEDDLSEEDDANETLLKIAHTFLDNDHAVPHHEATEVHEAEIVDRFENDCLPPILNYSPSNEASAPNQPPPSVHLPSFHDTFRSQDISIDQNNAANENRHGADSTNQPSHSLSTAAPEPVEPKFWPEDVAQSRATETNPLLDSGAEFLKSPLKDHPELEHAVKPLDFDESSAYQFEVTKKAIIQQQQQQQQVQLGSTHEGANQPRESQENSLHSKRKAVEISEVTAEEMPFAQRDPAQGSSSLSTKPRSLDDSAMDTSETDVHPGPNEPPVKRLRKAAEIFGYAALGGVAVMSALIATAPTL